MRIFSKKVCWIGIKNLEIVNHILLKTTFSQRELPENGKFLNILSSINHCSSKGSDYIHT